MGNNNKKQEILKQEILKQERLNQERLNQERLNQELKFKLIDGIEKYKKHTSNQIEYISKDIEKVSFKLQTINNIDKDYKTYDISKSHDTIAELLESIKKIYERDLNKLQEDKKRYENTDYTEYTNLLIKY